MERPLETDTRLRYAAEQFDVVLALNDIGQAAKTAWWVILKLSDFRFRKRLSLSPANVASPLGLSDKRGLDYLRDLHGAGLLHVHALPDGKSRRPGANRWDCCLLDPSVDRDEQLQLIADDPQHTFEFADDEDQVADDAAGREGSRQAGPTPSVVSFTRGHDAHRLVESPQVAMPAGPPAPAAKMAPSSPQVSPEPLDVGPKAPQPPLHTSLRLNQSKTSYFSGTSGPLTRPGSHTREATSSGNRANFTPKAPDPIGIGSAVAGLADGLIARALSIDPVERLGKIGKLADWLKSRTVDARRPNEKLFTDVAHKVATAIVDGDVELQAVEKVFFRADKRADSNELNSRLGFCVGGFRNVFKNARLDWRTGHKQPN